MTSIKKTRQSRIRGTFSWIGLYGNDFHGWWRYDGPSNEAESIATIHRSAELGGNWLDTPDLYGPLIKERLIAKAIKGNREKYVIATKFGSL